MGDYSSTRSSSEDFGFGIPTSAGGVADTWSDPVDQRAQLKRQLLRYQAGFLILGGALVVASVLSVGRLVLQHLGLIPILIWMSEWQFEESSVIVLGSLTGVCLLWGRWPDERWKRRSGLLLLMCLVDLVAWSIDYATRLGFSDLPFGHDYFRDSLGAAIGWSEFALIASLAAELAGSLGESRAFELGKAARSLTSLTAAIWLIYFLVHTNWNPPVWPLRPFRRNILTFNLVRFWLMLHAILLVQVTLLCLSATRACGWAVRTMNAEDRANEAPHSPSERGWDELQGEANHDFNPWGPTRNS